MAPASGEPERPEASRAGVPDSDAATASDAEVSLIRVTSPVNAALRSLRAHDPEKARVVDDAIRRIPSGAGRPIRIDVPGAPGRGYRAIDPKAGDAPVVIYRSLEPSDDVQGGWLVTTLIERDTYGQYLRAEERGLLDAPVVREVATSVAGTVSSIGVSSPAGPSRRG